jgi:succinyl-diaminopimelate desuccinylase
MKAGVAAFVVAAIRKAQRGQPRRGLTLVNTAGEETGCEGAFHLARTGALGEAELLIVAEPSSNLPITAHKGSVRLRVTAAGKTAHSSMPELGENAIYKIIGWIAKIDALNFADQSHPLLGRTTASVTTVFGGQNINSVPDAAGSLSISGRSLRMTTASLSRPSARFAERRRQSRLLPTCHVSRRFGDRAVDGNSY